jgi:hypothetical protein
MCSLERGERVLSEKGREEERKEGERERRREEQGEGNSKCCFNPRIYITKYLPLLVFHQDKLCNCCSNQQCIKQVKMWILISYNNPVHADWEACEFNLVRWPKHQCLQSTW